MSKQSIQKIIPKLFSSSGSISSYYTTKQFWIEKYSLEEYNEIFELTSFLPYNVKFTERLYNISNNITTRTYCYCGNPVKFKNFTLGYRKTCSCKCNNNSPEKIKKCEDAILVKYGVKNVFLRTDIQEKARATKKENWPEGNRSNWKKRINTRIQNDIEKGDFLINEDLEYLYDIETFIPWNERKYRCKKCGKEFSMEKWMRNNQALRCPDCEPLKSSKLERLICEYITELGFEYSINNRAIITPKEIDVYIPNKKLGIEIHGLLWHSYGSDSKSYLNNVHLENKFRHAEKYDLALKKDIKLLQIFQNEIEDNAKFDIWKSMISNHLGKNEKIYARKCEVIEVSSQEAKEFLNENHLQGNTIASYRYGLKYNNQLVALLTIVRSRFNKKYEWEIARYANKKYNSVIGGFSKLLKYFRNNHSGSIITYADKRYSQGKLYKSNGFNELKDSAPNYFYFMTKEMKLYPRMKFQKHKLSALLDTYDSSKTEAENMFINGWRRIWDCGNKVFVLE